MAGARKKPNKKNGNYQGYYRDHTGRRVFFLGTTSRQETKQIAQQLEGEHRQIALGVKPAPRTPARHRRRPFLEVVDEYVAWGKAFGRPDGRGWTERWAGDVHACLKKWAETLSIDTLADLDGILPRVEATLRQLNERDYAGRTVGAYVKPLVAFCNWCIGHGYLVANPLEKLAKIDQTPETERRAMTPEEIAKVFDAAPGWRRLTYAVAIITGLRLSELRRLDRIDLDVENSRLCLRWKLTKNRKPAMQYLPAKLAAALAAFADSGAPKRLYERAHTRRALPDSPLLFVPSHLLRLFNGDLQKAQIVKENPEGKLDFHALRATGITLWDEARASPKQLQAMARHSDPRLTFNIYAKARDRRMAKLAEKVGGMLPVSGAESATGVHRQGQGQRKTLPAQQLEECGSRRRGGSPGFLRPRHAAATRRLPFSARERQACERPRGIRQFTSADQAQGRFCSAGQVSLVTYKSEVHSYMLSAKGVLQETQSYTQSRPAHILLTLPTPVGTICDIGGGSGDKFPFGLPSPSYGCTVPPHAEGLKCADSGPGPTHGDTGKVCADRGEAVRIRYPAR